MIEKKRGVIMQKDSTTLMDKLKDYMQDNSFNQKQIAQQLCVNESTVSRWLNNGNIIHQHRNAIKFLISGHVASYDLKCAISGNDKCPFDGASQPKKALLHYIETMTDEMVDEMLARYFELKSKPGGLNDIAKAG
jgi:factor 1 (HNF-1)-like protein